MKRQCSYALPSRVKGKVTSNKEQSRDQVWCKPLHIHSVPFQHLGMVRNMVIDEGGDEEVAVIITLLHAQQARWVSGRTPGTEQKVIHDNQDIITVNTQDGRWKGQQELLLCDIIMALRIQGCEVRHETAWAEMDIEQRARMIPACAGPPSQRCQWQLPQSSGA